MCSILFKSPHLLRHLSQQYISQSPGGTMMILQTKPMPELTLTSPSVWKCKLWKALLNFGEWVEIQWCQIRTIGKVRRNLQSPSVQEVHTLSCHGFCLTTVSQYSQWLPTYSCILQRKNTSQFTLLPLSTLSVWSSLFNLC